MRRLLCLLLVLISSAALAQNPTCPTRPVGQSDNSCASTSFVQQNLSSPTNLSTSIDTAFGSTRGSILERGISLWGSVAPGTSGLPWVSNGAGADPAYQALGNSGLANMAATSVKCNSTASSAAPTDCTRIGLGTVPASDMVIGALLSSSGGIARISMSNPNTAAGTQARYDLSTGTTNSFTTLSLTDGTNPFFSITNGPGVTTGIGIDARQATNANIFITPGSNGNVIFGDNSGVTARLFMEGSTSGSFTISANATGSPQYGGTITNDNVATGNIGEFVSSSVASGSAVSLTSSTPANITSVSLTAGDWDCTASLVRTFGATTSITVLKTSLSTTSATDGSLATGTMDQFSTAAQVPVNDHSKGIGPVRFSLSATTTVFLVADDTFTVSTDKGYGFLRCRRTR